MSNLIASITLAFFCLLRIFSINRSLSCIPILFKISWSSFNKISFSTISIKSFIRFIFLLFVGSL